MREEPFPLFFLGRRLHPSRWSTGRRTSLLHRSGTPDELNWPAGVVRRRSRMLGVHYDVHSQLSESSETLVGTPRFELGTPCTPCKCATRLRHVPTVAR